MRSNENFIELTVNNNKYLFNKRSIIYVTSDERSNHAVVIINGADRQMSADRNMKCIAKEDYADVASELLWGYDPKNVCIDDYEIDLNVDGGAE